MGTDSDEDGTTALLGCVLLGSQGMCWGIYNGNVSRSAVCMQHCVTN